MLEYYYQTAHRLRQLRRKPLAEHIEALAEKLHRLGFKKGSGRRILNMTGKFNDFARSVGVENAESIDEGLIRRFFNKELPSRGTFRDAPTMMRHLLEHLSDRGVLSKVAATESFYLVLRAVFQDIDFGLPAAAKIGRLDGGPQTQRCNREPRHHSPSSAHSQTSMLIIPRLRPGDCGGLILWNSALCARINGTTEL